MNIFNLIWFTVHASIYRLFHPNSYVILRDDDDEEMYSQTIEAKPWKSE